MEKHMYEISMEILKEYVNKRAYKDNMMVEIIKYCNAVGIVEIAVNKQLEKIVLKQTTIVGETYGYCPTCGTFGLKKSVHKHCYECGQKLLWLDPINVCLMCTVDTEKEFEELFAC